MKKRPQKTIAKGAGGAAAGFTLLEVLVATAILGSAVAALFGLLSGALTNAQRLEPPAQALLLGEGQLNELLVKGLSGPARVQSGEAPQLALDQKVQGRFDDRYRWEASATRSRSSAQPIPGETILVKVVFDVFWKTRSEQNDRKITLETYQLWREPVGGSQ